MVMYNQMQRMTCPLISKKEHKCATEVKGSPAIGSNFFLVTPTWRVKFQHILWKWSLKTPTLLITSMLLFFLLNSFCLLTFFTHTSSLTNFLLLFKHYWLFLLAHYWHEKIKCILTDLWPNKRNDVGGAKKWSNRSLVSTFPEKLSALKWEKASCKAVLGKKHGPLI